MIKSLLHKLIHGDAVNVVDKAFNYIERQTKRGNYLNRVIIIEGGSQEERLDLINKLSLRDGVTLIDSLTQIERIGDGGFEAKILKDADYLSPNLLETSKLMVEKRIYEGHEFTDSQVEALNPSVYLQFRDGLLTDNFDRQSVIVKDDRDMQDVANRIGAAAKKTSSPKVSNSNSLAFG